MAFRPRAPHRRSRTRPRHFSMLRSFVLADLLTLGNAACGTLSLFMCLEYMDSGILERLWVAFGLLPIALMLDVMDGFVARKRHSHSVLGADLDSLADVISFGAAPAVLGYTLGLRGGWDMAILVYFVACGIARLARYNVTAADLAGPTGKVRYYEGTPIPTSLALVLVLFIATLRGRTGTNLWWGELSLGLSLHPLALLYALSGSAMISKTLRIPKP